MNPAKVNLRDLVTIAWAQGLVLNLQLVPRTFAGSSRASSRGDTPAYRDPDEYGVRLDGNGQPTPPPTPKKRGRGPTVNVTCRGCKKVFKKQGIKSHTRACPAMRAVATARKGDGK